MSKGPSLYPVILRTNKQIHEESASVLYGENIFTWPVNGLCPRRMWHSAGSDKSRIPRHYSLLITKLHFLIGVSGSNGDWMKRRKAIFSTRESLQEACTQLAGNNLNLFYVYFESVNSVRLSPSSERHIKAISEEQLCLEPLKDVRARKVSLSADTHIVSSH